MRNRTKSDTPRWAVVACVFVALVVVMPAATVTITANSTNVSTRTKSEPDGLFLFAGVLPGSYTLKVEAGGFKTLVKGNLNLTAGERLTRGNFSYKSAARRRL